MRAGGNSPEGESTSVSLQGDTIPPSVITTTPDKNAINVSAFSSLMATFSEPVASVTAATSMLKDRNNNIVTGSITTNGATVTFTLPPTTHLAYGALYTAPLTTGITDLAGNALLTDFVWSFTTEATPDTTPPTVTATSPVNGSTAVSISSAITATFSEPMTVTAGTFLLSPPVIGNITVSGRTITFVPSTLLLPNTRYTATLTTGNKDLAGNPLATNFIWSFTTASGATPTHGLDFPGSAAVATTMRFRFINPHTNGLPIYGPSNAGVTYIWRAYPRQQTSYYTAFFGGNDNGGDNNTGFRWNNGLADTYYGAHPYPDNPPNGSTHKWEIALESNDFVNGTVVYDRWYIQALRVWKDVNNNKHHEFYWDLPNTDAAHMVSHTSGSQWNNLDPPEPALTWGDAPWNPGAEVWNGVLRGIQIYATNLSLADIQSEIASPLSTSAGANSIWYLNVNPTPTDISDKSGKGHHPEWVGSELPSLYSGP